ncbi:GNAT family N-acetyltransferase [Embleya scabrispora]|uniref:GNAT family N-acetyltransferase n=1 Tax=Embleya scabrispora TaxID=159449 RepID=UPI000475CCBF|nr:GNAT family N-acetyltransferase [Embleya scabrispora]MYS85625.1 GNAT family N-acetyltransferase [Streptomyces sp. SID5474]
MSTAFAPVPARVATTEDIDAIVATLTTAFFDDPMWGPAFPDVGRRTEQAAALWRLFATSTLRYPWTLVTEHVEAAALWIPPGGTELSADEADGLEKFLVDNSDRTTADNVLRVLELLGAAQPAEPHFFLSLLATHDDHRGRGLGMGLLAESLNRIDALGAPAYLESSNPANHARYARAGFAPLGTVTLDTGHIVTTMWRPARDG